jgi:hypothetical protein
MSTRLTTHRRDAPVPLPEHGGGVPKDNRSPSTHAGCPGVDVMDNEESLSLDERLQRDPDLFKSGRWREFYEFNEDFEEINL